MTIIITLFIIGLVLLAFEVITPGAVLGVLGGVAMLAGCAVTWSRFGTNAGLIAIAVALALAGITIYLELVLLAKTKFGQQMFNKSAISGTSQPPPAAEADVLGRECEAITMLAPTGYVLLGGKRYDARSLDGLIEKGTHLIVASLDNFTLQVTKK